MKARARTTQETLLIELLTLVALGIANDRLHLRAGWKSNLEFEDKHLARMVLDLQFDIPSSEPAMVFPGWPHGGSDDAACRVAIGSQA